MIRFIEYVQKRGSDENDKANDLRFQRSKLRRLAKQDGLVVVSHLQDTTASAIADTRPGFIELLNRIRAGEAEGILCYGLHQLTCNVLEMAVLVDMLKGGPLKAIRTLDRLHLPDDTVDLKTLAWVGRWERSGNQLDYLKA